MSVARDGFRVVPGRATAKLSLSVLGWEFGKKPGPGRPSPSRERYQDGGPVGAGRLGSDLAAVGLDDGLRDGEAEAGPRRIGRLHESIEERVPKLGRKAGPFVGDLDRNGGGNATGRESDRAPGRGGRGGACRRGGGGNRPGGGRGAAAVRSWFGAAWVAASGAERRPGNRGRAGARHGGARRLDAWPKQRDHLIDEVTEIHGLAMEAE